MSKAITLEFCLFSVCCYHLVVYTHFFMLIRCGHAQYNFYFYANPTLNNFDD